MGKEHAYGNEARPAHEGPAPMRPADLNIASADNEARPAREGLALFVPCAAYAALSASVPWAYAAAPLGAAYRLPLCGALGAMALAAAFLVLAAAYRRLSCGAHPPVRTVLLSALAAALPLLAAFAVSALLAPALLSAQHAVPYVGAGMPAYARLAGYAIGIAFFPPSACAALSVLAVCALGIRAMAAFLRALRHSYVRLLGVSAIGCMAGLACARLLPGSIGIWAAALACAAMLHASLSIAMRGICAGAHAAQAHPTTMAGSAGRAICAGDHAASGGGE